MRLLATLSAFLLAGTVLATPLHNVVIFGDSLSDNGNLYDVMKHQLPPSPPYFEGRFSNGSVWVERLVASYFPENSAAHLLNYAFGGAGVSENEDDDDVLFTLRKEVSNYLLGHGDKASADSLFIVWIGANNYLALPEEADETIEEVRVGIVHSLQRLADKGAKHIMVVNIPDLGRTPAAREFDSAKMMTYFTREHNKHLVTTVNNLKQQYPDVQWIYFDMNEAFGRVLDNPQEHGFTNVTDTCANTLANDMPQKSVLRMVSEVKPGNSDACDGYMFFDLVHPTAHAHEVLANRTRAILDDLGIIMQD